ncbi:hypothetical protein GLOTRDRAFT_113542 [Gloeophyllum trabeum ATCC 11539]|uniref:Uncharacterized protein n=1 Tax=Gloeophyllum trabeum (strain ATCC 11539 / FP-39264 / Madison 617) TaxID=670483 RepID=S7QNI5_GLOTA|nr:uncharacterized protein GLOTRDRAFT_113542 [Gloeophyllum trabeum ATCC 11539]EPQ61083.1 hypothetical protein GLOTRDRAFT_113542 [Gloeophyllum trabeum ATCC 11539]
MRVKQVLSLLPLAKVQLLWERISLNKLTLFYFIFSVVHCIVQIVFQVQAFTINAQAEAFLNNIIARGNATGPGFPVFNGEELRWCNTVPENSSTESCQPIWNGSSSKSSSPASTSPALNAASMSTSVTSSTVSSSTAVSTSASASVSSAVSQKSSTAVSTSSSSASGSPSFQRAAATAVTTVKSVPSTVTATVTAIATAVPSPSLKFKDDDDDDEEEDDEEEEDEEHEHDHRKRDLFGMVQIAVNGSVTVNINGFGNDDRDVSLDQTCLVSLNWPALQLADTKREDVTFIAFQVWVLGMSLVALLNESIPHIIASLLTHALATSWAAFAVSDTGVFHKQFTHLTSDGPCHQPSLLPAYWKARGDAEIPGLALNAAALLLSSFLSWRLIRLFGWQTFKRVGASFTINRVYKFVLSLTIVIQLSLFFIVASLGLWLDQLWNGQIGMMTEHALRLKSVVLVVFILLFPWLAMGWFAVRRELKIFMLIFIALSLLYVTGWAAMFVSRTFRWTFLQWRFFSIITSASVFLTLMTFVLGVICRLNFGKGLPRYLNAQEPLPGDDFEPVSPGSEKMDEEKVQFPDHSVPVPTYSAAFGSGNEVPPPSQMFAPRQMGPRFTQTSSNMTFGGHSSMTTVQPPYIAHVRKPSNASSTYYSNGTTLSRHDSRGSQNSYSSQSSGHGSDRTIGGKRWVIE